MGEQKFALKPLAEAAEQALVAAVGSGDEQDMRNRLAPPIATASGRCSTVPSWTGSQAVLV